MSAISPSPTPSRMCWGRGPFGGCRSRAVVPRKGAAARPVGAAGLSGPSQALSLPGSLPWQMDVRGWEQAVGQFKPPTSLEVPDPTVAQVLVVAQHLARLHHPR